MAIRILRRAQRLEPEESAIRLQIASHYLKLGHRGRAERELHKALAIEESANGLVLLAYALDGQGRNTEAIGYLRRALEIEPNFDEVHHNLGCLYLATEDRPMAEHHFRKAIELNDKEASAFRGLAECLLDEAGDPDSELLEVLRRASRLDPSDRKSRLLLATMLEQADRCAEAGRTYRAIIKRWPDASAARWPYGAYLVGQGNLRRVISHEHDPPARKFFSRHDPGGCGNSHGMTHP